MRSKSVAALSAEQRQPKAGDAVITCRHLAIEADTPVGTHWYGSPEGFGAHGPEGTIEADWFAVCDACHALGDLRSVPIGGILELSRDIAVEPRS